MIIKHSLTTIDNLENIPSMLYKYRECNNKFHEDILNEQTVYMASPSEFTDPNDCKIPTRYDLIKKPELLKIYVEESKTKNPHYSRSQHRTWAREHSKNSPIKSKEKANQLQKEEFEKFEKKFGVLSLTANPTNNKMWEEYSQNHEGFCVGFNSKNIFKHFGGGGNVIYVDKLPDIYFDDNDDVKISKQVFYKLKEFSYEEEYRTHKLYYPKEATTSDRQIKLPKECISEVVFGSKITSENRNRIISLCNEQGLVVTFFQAYIEKETIQLREIQ